MCLLAYVAANQKMPKEHFERGFAMNPEGGGFAYIENGEVKIQKGFFKVEEMWDAFNAIQQTNALPKIVHFRKKSYGKVDMANCHPHRIDRQHVMAHNGTIWDFSVANADYSDTAAFNHNILKKMFADYPDFWKKDYARWMMEEAIGSFNKIIILDASAEYRIFNESKGEWVGGCWYSNDSYKMPEPKKKSKKHKKNKYKHLGGIKKKKLKGTDFLIPKELLTQQQMSELTHKYGMKMRFLATRGDVVAVEVD